MNLIKLPLYLRPADFMSCVSSSNDLPPTHMPPQVALVCKV